MSSFAPEPPSARRTSPCRRIIPMRNAAWCGMVGIPACSGRARSYTRAAAIRSRRPSSTAGHPTGRSPDGDDGLPAHATLAQRLERDRQLLPVADHPDPRRERPLGDEPGQGGEVLAPVLRIAVEEPDDAGAGGAGEIPEPELGGAAEDAVERRGPARREAMDGLAQCLATDPVEDECEGTDARLLEVEDHHVGAEPPRLVLAVRAADQGGDPRPGSPRELDRELPHPAGRAGHEHAAAEERPAEP